MRIHPAAALLVGIVIGVSAMWALGRSQLAAVSVIEGEGFASSDYDALAVAGESYALTPPWQVQGTWHTSWPPDCLPTGEDEPISMRVGIVEVERDEEGHGGSQVAWLRCGVGGN